MEHIVQSSDVLPLRSNPYRFECGDCGLPFTRKDHLKTHCRTKHSKPPTIIYLQNSESSNVLEENVFDEIENSENCNEDETNITKTSQTLEESENSENCDSDETNITKPFQNPKPETETDKRLDSDVIMAVDTQLENVETPTSHENEINLETFYRKMELSDPRYSQKSRYMCLRCDSLFKSPSNIKVHILSVHLGIKSFSCDQCSLKFVNQTILLSHVKNVHFLKSKKIQCHLCGDSFTSGQALKYHVFRIHDKVRRFGCDQVKTKFSLLTFYLLLIPKDVPLELSLRVLENFKAVKIVTRRYPLLCWISAFYVL